MGFSESVWDPSFCHGPKFARFEYGHMNHNYIHIHIHKEHLVSCPAFTDKSIGLFFLDVFFILRRSEKNNNNPTDAD